MKRSPMKTEVQDSYALCRRVARRAASSFYLSFLFLPKPQRDAMCALYAFLRRVDDIADTDAPVSERQQELARWREALDAALAGQWHYPMFPAIEHMVRRYQIPTRYFHDAIDGAEMDLTVDRYATFDELNAYCYRAASVVGLACLRIWGCTDAAAEEPARKCGLAFQLTNILRDVAEDAVRGRIYLPLEDLAHFGCSEEDILNHRNCDRVAQLIAFQANRAHGYYMESAPLESYLPRDGRRAWRVMITTYRAILDELWRRKYNVFGPRLRLTKWQRVSLAVRGLVMQPSAWKSASGERLPHRSGPSA